MKNVFGLSREKNQSLEVPALTWGGYTSGGMNLAEEQDHTCSVATCLAKQWQQAVDKGENLPDLYIVHIALGAQGISSEYMWYPDRVPKLIPGVQGVADISLYPFTRHILSLLDDSFRAMGKTYEIIGCHWRGGEQESIVSDVRSIGLEELYRRMIREFRESVGFPMPFVLHQIHCPDAMMDMDPTGKYREQMYYINDVFDNICASEENVQQFDVRQAPQYIPGVWGNGIFLEVDNIHFTKEVNHWVAQAILDDYRHDKTV
jgi:hypothetical protein